MKNNFNLRIFIGYDNREKIAYHVLSKSIIENSSIPVTITPIKLENLKKFYKRKKGLKDSTEFSISRFLTPYLSNYEGYSLFLDCDFIVKGDIAQLLAIIKKDKNKALWCVKHNHNPKEIRKFLGEKQLKYNKKNWSSFVIYNNNKCKVLKPNLVSKANGLYLHQFKWIKDSLIGSLPSSWNVLVGYQKIPKKFNALHYTKGGPYFKEFRSSPGAKYWLNHYKDLLLKI
jgi:lipopolysaccharide biosynthesis glycosyltransferase